MFQDDYEEVGDVAPAAKLHLADLPMMLFGSLAEIARAFVNIFNSASNLFAMHSNYRTKVDVLRDDTLRDIEALPTTEDGE